MSVAEWMTGHFVSQVLASPEASPELGPFCPSVAIRVYLEFFLSYYTDRKFYLAHQYNLPIFFSFMDHTFGVISDNSSLSPRS